MQDLGAHTAVAASLCNTIVDCACAGVQGAFLNFCSAIGLMLGDLRYMRFCDCCKNAHDNKYEYCEGALPLTTRIFEPILANRDIIRFSQTPLAQLFHDPNLCLTIMHVKREG